MEITTEDLKQIFDSLPDPNNYHRAHYCVVLPIKIDVIMNRSFAPDPSLRDDNELFLKRVRNRLGGYTWSINLDSETELLKATERVIQHHKNSEAEMRHIAEEAIKELRFKQLLYNRLLNRPYVKFFINVRIWKTYLAMKFAKLKR